MSRERGFGGLKQGCRVATRYAPYAPVPVQRRIPSTASGHMRNLADFVSACVSKRHASRDPNQLGNRALHAHKIGRDKHLKLLVTETRGRGLRGRDD